jgi:hypothetical protein
MFDDIRIDSGAIAHHQITDSGFLKCYMRLAVADRNLVYRSPLGGKRTEFINADNLFRADSLDTFIGVPITNEHPLENGRPLLVDSSNVSRFAKGANGSSFIREVTPFGTFLGTIATIHDGALVDEIVSGKKPGVSPGYRVPQSKLHADSRHEQLLRIGNHVAACTNPRGGEHVRSVLEGLRTDGVSDAELDYWLQDADLELYQVQIDEALILPLMDKASLMQTGDMPKVIEKKPIILQLKNDACACQSTSGEQPKMINLIIGDEAVEVSADLADKLRPVLAKAAAYDELEEGDESAVVAGSLLGTGTTNPYLMDSEEEDLFANALEVIESLEARVAELEAGEDEERTDAVDDDQLLAIAREIAFSVAQLRADAEAVGLQFDESSTAEEQFNWLAENYDDAQRMILAHVSPTLNTDSYEGEVLDAVYEARMTDVRNDAKGGKGKGKDKKKMMPPWLKKGKSMESEDDYEDEEDDDMKTDSATPAYGQLLKTVGALSRSGGNSSPAKSQADFRKLMEQQQDAQFGKKLSEAR